MNNATWFEKADRYFTMKKSLGRELSQKAEDICEKRLAQWRDTQKKNYESKAKCMTEERIQYLKDRGFIFELRKTVPWMTMLVSYINWCNENNKEASQASDDPEEVKYAVWANTQRTANKNNKLPEDRKNKLIEAGFRLDPNIKVIPWKTSLKNYIAIYQQKGGRLDINSSNPKEVVCARWAATQRSWLKRDVEWLDEERRKLLSELDLEPLGVRRPRKKKIEKKVKKDPDVSPRKLVVCSL